MTTQDSSQNGPQSGLPEDTRERLIAVAKTLFAAKGFNGTTVKDLAEAAGVNISLVSYHFGGKEGLFRTCLETFGVERLAAAQRMLQPAKSSEEFRIRLRMFVEEMIQFHMKEECAARIIHRDADLELDFVEDVFKNTFMKVFGTMVEFFSSAQKAGILRDDLDPLLMTGNVFGALINTIHKDPVASKYFGRSISDPDHREQYIDSLVSMTMYGCAKP
jgi:TetR/AcrR family transcriptional regulator